MDPVLRPGVYCFVVSEDANLMRNAFAVIREDEGTTLIVEYHLAPHSADPMVCITLSVHSALDGVGLTAAVSVALAAEKIPVNVVAGFHHDHIFVPEADAKAALTVLRATQDAAC